jgi:hypothetical protein
VPLLRVKNPPYIVNVATLWDFELSPVVVSCYSVVSDEIENASGVSIQEPGTSDSR